MVNLVCNESRNNEDKRKQPVAYDIMETESNYSGLLFESPDTLF